MLKRYRSTFGGIFRIIDASAIGLSWLIAYELRFQTSHSISKGIPSLQKYTALCPVIIILWLAVFSWARVYPHRRALRSIDEIATLLKAHSIAILLFLTLTYLSTEYRYSRGVIIYFSVFSGIFLIFSRLFFKSLLQNLKFKKLTHRNILAIGESRGLEKFLTTTQRFPELGLNVIGIVTQASPTRFLDRYPILGDFNSIQSILSKFHPDEIIISLARSEEIYLDSILTALNHETIPIQLIPDLHQYITIGCEIEDFDHTPIIHLNESPLQGWAIVWKKITDLIISLLLLICFAPLFFLITLGILLTSRGPIFYTQERMGLDGRIFKMFKFRSMKHEAEALTGAVWADPQDQRKTKFGTFLRKTSLDELPQLWNVLRGDMSLVGPRPERPIFVEKFKHDIPHYMLRHKVKSGMTGWAQIHGWRGNTSLQHRIEYDLYYIKNWSYTLDLKILILTPWKGFINKNAY